MTISLVNSINNIDKKLLEVADVFHLTKFKKWKYIIVPSLYPAFETALIVCLGTGVKLVVMAEVLTIDSGIGGQITNARINIETEMVIAWSVIIVGIYFILGGIVKCLKKCQWIRKFWYQSLLVKNIMKKLILDNINFEMFSGEILGLLGPSGIGKTTLLNILVGLEKETSGEIINYHNNKIGYVFQEDRLLNWLTLLKI